MGCEMITAEKVQEMLKDSKRAYNRASADNNFLACMVFLAEIRLFEDVLELPHENGSHDSDRKFFRV